MTEKVNPSHPDKMADRIAGALVDLAYSKIQDPKIAVEVLIGHGTALIIAETSVNIETAEVFSIVDRITDKQVKDITFRQVPQDWHLADNQTHGYRCGDNGIFKGMPVTREEQYLSDMARALYNRYPYDGKFILDGKHLTVCQSCAKQNDLEKFLRGEADPAMIDLNNMTINPLGYWTGGLDVDSGATNRKLGSDMARGVTGGGLHGKDLTKADVAVNIWCHIEAQRIGQPVERSCAIGDEKVYGIYYSAIVEQARRYISDLGGFEKFAEWGLI